MRIIMTIVCGVFVLVSACAQEKNEIQVCNVATTNTGKKTLIGVEVFITGKIIPVGGLPSGIGKTSLMVPIKGSGETTVRVVYQLQEKPGNDIEVNVALIIPENLSKDLVVSIDHSKSPAVELAWK